MLDIFSSLNALTSTGAFDSALTSALTSTTASGLFTLASLTSRSIILPLGPVAVAVFKSTPSFAAKFLALGEAKILSPSCFAAVATGVSAGASTLEVSALTSTTAAVAAPGAKQDASTPCSPTAKTFSPTAISSP